MLADKKKKWMLPDKTYNQLLYLEQETFRVKEKMIENVDKIMANLEKVDDIKEKSSSVCFLKLIFSWQTSQELLDKRLQTWQVEWLELI
jgi:hypothetical protein